jgi:hypothetical protein
MLRGQSGAAGCDGQEVLVSGAMAGGGESEGIEGSFDEYGTEAAGMVCLVPAVEQC